MASSIVAMNEGLSLLIASIVIALVFGSRYLLLGSYLVFGIVTVAAILAVIPHELMHRWSARKLGCYSRYVLYPMGLLLTLATAIPYIPFKIIIPGFVVISCGYIAGESLKRVDGVTSFAGPVTNILISSLSLILFRYLYNTAVLSLASIIVLRTLDAAAVLNAWVAFFNLLPVPPLDGSKIIRWSPILWIISFATSIALLLTSGFL